MSIEFQCSDHFHQALQLCESREVRDRLLTMISRLIYFVLNEYRIYICDLYSDTEMTNSSEQRPWIHYKQSRSLLMRIFSSKFFFVFRCEIFAQKPNFVFLVDSKEFPKGKHLAEEFEDFQAMIEICDELKDVQQLRIYIEKFKEKVSNCFVLSSNFDDVFLFV